MATAARILLLWLALVSGVASERLPQAFINVTANGDLALTQPPGKTVVPTGLDVLAIHASVTARVDVLEANIRWAPQIAACQWRRFAGVQTPLQVARPPSDSPRVT